MNELIKLCTFNAAYCEAIDSDELEKWPTFFTPDCRYRITNVDNEREGLAAGIIYADSRDMLEDRIAALRQANIYERQRYRHLLGMPLISASAGGEIHARTPFMIARIMLTGETDLFATGVYADRFIEQGDRLLLADRVVVCDSTVTDTLLALPL
ncbi:MAG TPA: aromatic-ring-hydroxylating dioxygenase subunit beta [Burkholderiaceae bacterium]|jgi:anthranilate 1,2-dioxygenase small subunit/terephthalate 1,2-dioxygenase oxygenase component beta subunit